MDEPPTHVHRLVLLHFWQLLLHVAAAVVDGAKAGEHVAINCT